MALLEQNVWTLADHATRWGTKEAQTDALDIIDTMAQRNPILDYLPWTPTNMERGHKSILRVEHPQVAWAQLNKGMVKGKSVSTAIIDTTASLEAYCEVDKRLKKTVSNFTQMLDDEARAFMESLSNEFASIFWYGDEVTEPNAFTGLTPRYNSLAMSQVVSGGGSGSDNASIWILNLGQRGITGLFPRNSTSGIHRESHPDIPTTDGSGNRYFAYGQSFYWDCGLAVVNYKEAVRICNIDVSEAQANSASAADLVRLITRASSLLYTPPRAFMPVNAPGVPGGTGQRAPQFKTVICMNPAIYALLREQANDRTVNGLMMGQAFGAPYGSIEGMPVILNDALLNTEAAVS